MSSGTATKRDDAFGLQDLGGVCDGPGVADALDVAGGAIVELEVGTLGFEDEQGSKNFLRSSLVNGVDMGSTRSR